MFLRETKYSMRIIPIVNKCFNASYHELPGFKFWFRGNPYFIARLVVLALPLSFSCGLHYDHEWGLSVCLPGGWAARAVWFTLLGDRQLHHPWHDSFCQHGSHGYITRAVQPESLHGMVPFASDSLILDRQVGQQHPSQQFAFLLIFLPSLQYASTSAT